MDRRRFLLTSLAGAVAAPLAADAQQRAKVHRIGFLGLSSSADYAPNLAAFRQGLRDLGYEEGKKISIEYRWAENRYERLPALAVELARLQPDLLVTHALHGIRAAQQATTTIPIVMGVSADPVRQGLVRSLARPGGNTTGIASQLIDLSSKRLELLRETVPNLRKVAVLANLANAAAQESVKETEAAGRRLGVGVRSFAVKDRPAELETVFTAIQRERVEGLLMLPDSFLAGARNASIAEFAARNRLVSMGGERDFIAGGGLLSYGGNFQEGWRLAARYVDRILKGARPAELPIEQPMKFELTINLKTAKRLGLTIPPSLLARADQVIE